MALAVAVVATPATRGQVYPSGPQITKSGAKIHLQTYAILPKSTTSSTAQVARVNFLRSEPANPGADSRFFTNDLNGKVYILDKTTKSFTQYLDFPTIFGSAFDASPGFAAGVVTIQFDPEYWNSSSPHYGKFYTTHTEINPALDPNEYRQAVLTGWQDPNPNDTTITPAAVAARREMMRTTYQNNIHPIGDIVFNPSAGPGHSDYRNMYIGSGDGGAGETTAGRNHPQDLDKLIGKILRIHPDDPDGAGPLQYSSPASNPWASDGNSATLAEIWARGMRNPHRLSWDQESNKLIVNDIGLNRWEEVNLINGGANYGYSQREGNMTLSIPSTVGALPANDATFGYSYPAAAYSHEDGDAISSGFVYRGQRVPELFGKYIFADITTGRILYCDYAEMLAKDADGNPLTQATIHEFQVVIDGVERRFFDVVRDTFDLRNETASGSSLLNGTDDGDNLPGNADVTNGIDPYGVAYGGGRADIRIALGGDGELYILSKSDGMIRAVVPEPTGAGLALVGIALASLRRTRRAA